LTGNDGDAGKDDDDALEEQERLYHRRRARDPKFNQRRSKYVKPVPVDDVIKATGPLMKKRFKGFSANRGVLSEILAGISYASDNIDDRAVAVANPAGDRRVNYLRLWRLLLSFGFKLADYVAVIPFTQLVSGFQPVDVHVKFLPLFHYPLPVLFHFFRVYVGELFRARRLSIAFFIIRHDCIDLTRAIKVKES
jgi:hypothetical protein